jgi:predicted extracellular nuclease
MNNDEGEANSDSESSEESFIYCQEIFSHYKAGEVCVVTGHKTLARESKKRSVTNTVVTCVTILRKSDWH